ncbi:unnamed protein product, partial [Larinioides sclopetarius]
PKDWRLKVADQGSPYKFSYRCIHPCSTNTKGCMTFIDKEEVKNYTTKKNTNYVRKRKDLRIKKQRLNRKETTAPHH